MTDNCERPIDNRPQVTNLPYNLARRQLSDYDARHPGTVFSDQSFQLTVEQAYDLQTLVTALREKRGESVAGYKVGCVSETIRRQLGLSHPVFGRVFTSELHPSGCSLAPSGYDGLAIEGEFAVRLGADSSVVSAFPVIELHNYVFRRAPNAAELIANNAIHAGVIMPATEPLLAGIEELRHEPISVCINGEVRGTDDGGSLPEAIAESLRFLAERLPLAPGQLLLTGTQLPLYPVEPGDRIEIRTRRFPAVATSIGR